MLHYYNLEVSEVFIHDNFLINQVKEGIDIQPHHTVTLQEIIDKHFSDKPLVYIANRIHSYSVNPMTYGYAATIPNLVAFAIVVYNDKSRHTAQFEKDFYVKPFKILNNLTEAIAWTYKELERRKSQLKEFLKSFRVDTEELF